MTKRCSKCGEEKPLSAFAKSASRRDGRTTYCRLCMQAYNAAYYQRTKHRHNPARAARRRQVRAELTANLIAYLQQNPCVDCGESDVLVLQFDHRGEGKLFHIADGIRDGLPWERILAEVAKCDVVCANDHQRRTASFFGWRKLDALGLGR